MISNEQLIAFQQEAENMSLEEMERIEEELSLIILYFNQRLWELRDEREKDK